MRKGKVVNIRHEPCDVYIGRRGKGEDGYFGNPFRLEYGEQRGETIARYKRYFWDRINSDPEFEKRVRLLEDKKLGCFCKPSPCHGDVIKAWLDAGCPMRDNRSHE